MQNISFHLILQIRNGIQSCRFVQWDSENIDVRCGGEFRRRPATAGGGGSHQYTSDGRERETNPGFPRGGRGVVWRQFRQPLCRRGLSGFAWCTRFAFPQCTMLCISVYVYEYTYAYVSLGIRPPIWNVWLWTFLRVSDTLRDFASIAKTRRNVRVDIQFRLSVNASWGIISITQFPSKGKVE